MQEMLTKARLELFVRDENGNIIGQLAEYDVVLINPTLHGIEGAVKEGRQQVLPELESHLLSQAQTEFTQQAKKTTI